MIPRRIFLLFDLLALACAFLLAYFLLPSLKSLFEVGGALRTPMVELLVAPPPVWLGGLPQLVPFIWIFLAMVPAVLLVLGLMGNRRSLLHQSYTRIIAGGALAPIAGLSVISLTFFAFKSPGWSRLFVFSFAAFSGLGLTSYRVILRRYFMSRQAAGYYYKNVVLVGLPCSIEWMIRYFADNVRVTDFRLLGYLRVDSSEVAAPHSTKLQDDNVSSPLTALGSVEELGDLLIHEPIHEVIAIHPAVGGRWIEKVIEDCDYFGIPLRIVTESLLLGKRKSLKTLYPLEALHLPAVVLTPPRHWDSEALFLKRLFDIVVSAALLVLLLPLLVVISIAIKLTTSHLPIFYSWRVVGRNGVEFTGYKFSTMVPEADNLKSHLAEHNEMTGPVFKMKNDPRVTSLGKFLRKYSLNELPQLWSVLKGDMSLVGPRPAFRHELQRYEFWHKRKLSIQPGITCLWQVSGRNEIKNFDDWVAMDLEYIDNWSLWLDIKILFRTAKTVVAGTGW